jgi:hypothetical protein
MQTHREVSGLSVFTKYYRGAQINIDYCPGVQHAWKGHEMNKKAQ